MKYFYQLTYTVSWFLVWWCWAEWIEFQTGQFNSNALRCLLIILRRLGAPVRRICSAACWPNVCVEFGVIFEKIFRNSTLGPPNSCETRASSRSSGRYVSMSSILTRNRRNPYINIVGNFADKLNFMRKIDKTQKHHSTYDISTKHDYNVYRFFIDLTKKLFDGEIK